MRLALGHPAAAAATGAAPTVGVRAGAVPCEPAPAPPAPAPGYLAPTDGSTARASVGRRRRASLDALAGAARASASPTRPASLAASRLAPDAPTDTALSCKLAAAGLARVVGDTHAPSSSEALQPSPPRKPRVPSFARRRASTDGGAVVPGLAGSEDASAHAAAAASTRTGTNDRDVDSDASTRNAYATDAGTSAGSSACAYFGSFAVSPAVLCWDTRVGDVGAAADRVLTVRNVDTRAGSGVRQLQVGLPVQGASVQRLADSAGGEPREAADSEQPPPLPAPPASCSDCPFSVAAVSWPGDAPAATAAGYRGARYTSLLPPGLPLRVTVRYAPPPLPAPACDPARRAAAGAPAAAVLRLRGSDGSEFGVRLLAAAGADEGGGAGEADATEPAGAAAAADTATQPATPAAADAAAAPADASCVDVAATATAAPTAASLGGGPGPAPAARHAITCTPLAVTFSGVPLLTAAVTRSVTVRNDGAAAVRLRATVARLDGPPRLPLPPPPLQPSVQPPPPPAGSATSSSLSGPAGRQRRGSRRSSSGTRVAATAVAAGGGGTTRGARRGFHASAAGLRAAEDAAPAAAAAPPLHAAAATDGVCVTVSPSEAAVMQPGATLTLTLSATASVAGTYRHELTLQLEGDGDGEGGGAGGQERPRPRPVVVPVTVRAAGGSLRLRPGSVGLRVPSPASPAPTTGCGDSANSGGAAAADYGRLDFGSVAPRGPPARRTVTVVNTAPLPAQLTWRVAAPGDASDDDGADVPVAATVTVAGGGEDGASDQRSDDESDDGVAVAVSVRVEPTDEGTAAVGTDDTSASAGLRATAAAVFAVLSPPTVWIAPGGHAAVTFTAAAPAGAPAAETEAHDRATAALVGDVTWWRRGTGTGTGGGGGDRDGDAGGAVVSSERGAVVLAVRAQVFAPPATAGGDTGSTAVAGVMQ
jgi:hypothetical protein